MHVTNRFRRHVTGVIVFLTIVSITQAKYGGGSGTADEPYQIATAADLIALGESPEDYDKHFILTADIDLDPNLPGRKVFDKAVIARETPFTGVFDGNGHWLYSYRGADSLFRYVRGSSAQVKNLRLFKSDVEYHGIGTGSLLVGTLTYGTISNCHVQDCKLSSRSLGGAGGLVGSNDGTITDCHISGQIIGTRHDVGGLVAYNGEDATITRCSFSGSVGGGGGGSRLTGGLVGFNFGGISFCYSTGLVWGSGAAGLVGGNGGVVYSCYSISSVSGAGGLLRRRVGRR